jgi:hypothetical protein
VAGCTRLIFSLQSDSFISWRAGRPTSGHQVDCCRFDVAGGVRTVAAAGPGVAAVPTLSSTDSPDAGKKSKKASLWSRFSKQKYKDGADAPSALQDTPATQDLSDGKDPNPNTTPGVTMDAPSGTAPTASHPSLQEPSPPAPASDPTSDKKPKWYKRVGSRLTGSSSSAAAGASSPLVPLEEGSPMDPDSATSVRLRATHTLHLLCYCIVLCLALCLVGMPCSCLKHDNGPRPPCHKCFAIAPNRSGCLLVDQTGMNFFVYIYFFF